MNHVKGEWTNDTNDTNDHTNDNKIYSDHNC